MCDDLIRDPVRKEMLYMEMICGRYRVETLAGHGGFGSVYKGYDESMERDVAIKVVDSIGDREANILKALDHKSLPRLYDIYRDHDHTYMIMEWIEGIDLERYISMRGAMPEKKAAAIGYEILKVLDYLHRLRPALVYQDLKPANIMLMPDGHIKLVDFGTALVMNYGDEVKNLAGTVGYGAPEQRGICGERYASVRSDIYAWGAVMYCCLSGRMLNKPPYTMEKLKTVAPGVSYGLAHVIDKAVSRNPHERYESVRHVMEAMKTGRYRDALYRSGFLLLMSLFIVPFLMAWYLAYQDGVFAGMEAAVRDGHMTGYMHDIRTSRDMGYMFLTGGCMLLVFRRFQKRRFIRVNRSVYLSARKNPGLWMGALLAGAVMGAGIGGAEVPVSHAEEIGLTESVLPVSIVDENGDRILLKYDALYNPDGDLRLNIDSDFLAECGDGRLDVAYIPARNDASYSRSISLQIDSPMW